MQGSIQLTTLRICLIHKSSLRYDFCPYYYVIYGINQIEIGKIRKGQRGFLEPL